MVQNEDMKLFSIMAVIIIAIIVGYFIFSGNTNDGNSNNNDNGADNGPDNNGAVDKEIRVTASQWDFSPSVIKVNKGETVKLILESSDVPHGFSLPALGISKYIDSSGTTTAVFTADKEGTYTFYCSVNCGAGHGSMKGTLIVE